MSKNRSAAMLTSPENIPELGDVVTKVTISEDGQVADIYFGPDSWVMIHIGTRNPSTEVSMTLPKEIRVAGHLYRKADLFWAELENPSTSILDSRTMDHVNYQDAYHGEEDEVVFMAEKVSLDASMEDAQAIIDRYSLDVEPIEADDDPADVWSDVIHGMARAGKDTFVVGELGTYNLGVMDGEFGWIIELDEEDLFAMRGGHDKEDNED